MGDTILGNRYEIINKVGDGGMAFVYKAKDRLLNRTVAVKVLRPEFVDDEEFLMKFKREAEAVASLSHPNIVNVYDVGEDGKVHYIVMEYIDGQNLKEIINDEGTLDEYTALDITKQIARALGAAHKKGIIHRDIKPHNILISNEGRAVKVADFGIAKAVSNSTMTSIGSIIGSVHYFSPEQAKGKFVSSNADLYSLGIVLYEMLIGKVPFRGDSPISIALQHINDPIEFTSEEKVNIPQSVRTIIKKLTEKSSPDRYQNADELIEDIEYIEKNIDLDFIKEYDNFATKKVDENKINKAIRPTPIADLDDEDEFMDQRRETKPKKKQNKAKKNSKKQDNPKTRRRLKIAALVLIMILAAQVFVFYKLFSSNGLFSKNKGVFQAPNIVNMSLDDAQEELEKYGLTLKVRREEYDSSVERDHIISQTPVEGTEVEEGDIITVVVSKGGNTTHVPNVIGVSLSEAKRMLSDNNLKVGDTKYEYNAVYKEGVVLSQSPTPGASNIQEGEKINLVVSKGPEQVKSPENIDTERPNTEEPNSTTKPGSGTNTGSGSNSGNTTNPGGTNSGGGTKPGSGTKPGGGTNSGGGSSSGGGNNDSEGNNSGGNTGEPTTPEVEPED